MKIIKLIILLITAVVFTSCSSDDEVPQIHAPVSEDMEISMDENPTSDLVATILATDSEDHALTYTIVSQTPTESVIINETTGELFIADINAFDYEQNTIIVVDVSVSDGTTSIETQLTINILDVNENN